MSRFAAYVSLLVTLCLMVAGAGIQNSWAVDSAGSMTGKVLDQNGSGIAGAKVTIKNLETDSIQKTVTDNSGNYKAENLPLGKYTVVAELGNGKSVALNAVDVAMNAVNATVAATSAAAQITATVIVNAQAPMVEKTTSWLDNTENTKAILELPGRLNLDRLALLQNGVVPNRQNYFGSSYGGIINSLNYDGSVVGAVSPDFGSAFGVNGTRPNSNYFTIDGAYNQDPVRATNRQSMPPEAIQTFEMINGNFPAQVGRYGGSFLDQISRSGNTGIHGTLNYTYAGNFMNALSSDEKRAAIGFEDTGLNGGDAFRLARPNIVDNRADASAGFPIWKDKVFSFTSWDRDWFRATENPATIGIAPAGLANLSAFSTQFAPGTLNTLVSTFPVANTPVPLGQINLQAPVTGDIIPVPLAEFNRGVLGGVPYQRDYWRVMQHFEMKLSEKNSLNLRYLYDDLKDPGIPTAIFGQEVARNFKNHSGELNDVYIVSPTLVNEFRFSVGRLADRLDSDQGLGINIAGFNTIGNPNFPQRRKDTSYQASDYVAWSRPHHTLKIGADAIHYRMRADFPFNENGTLTFGSMEDFLLNQNAVFSQFSGNDFIRSNATEIGAFAQDDWKVSKTFSLNLGLRYEYMQIPEGLYSGILPSKKNFGPRFGFAWAPDAGGFLFEKTTIRGGYSLMYNEEVPWQLLPLAARNFPRGINTVIGPVTGLTALPGTTTAADFIASGGNPDLLPATVIGASSDGRFKTPYYQTYTLGLEREFGRDFVFRAYYVGTKGTHLYRQFEANPGITPAAFATNPGFFTAFGLQPVLDTTGDIAAYRLNPAFGSTMAIDPIGNSIYNSGQFSVIKRFGYGVQLGANYTYSSSIDYGSNFLIPASNPFDLGADRARSDLDQPHRFSGNYLFVIPTIWRDRPFMSRLISGWELSGITTVASGLPYTPINSQNALGLLPGMNPDVFTQFASVNPFGIPGTPTSIGVVNPFFVSNPENSGIFSNLGRNRLRTNRFINTDMAFVKNTRAFTEDQSLQLRFEVFNVFNHKSFTNVPLATVNGFTDVSRFLNLGETNALGRSMDFTARFFF